MCRSYPLGPVMLVLMSAILSVPGQLAADQPTKAAFEFGVHLGIVEHGVQTGAPASELLGHLQHAKYIAPGLSDELNKEIDRFSEKLAKSEDSRELYQSILMLRARFAHSLAHPANPQIDSHDVPLGTIVAMWEGEWNTSYGKMTLCLAKDGRICGNYGGNRHCLVGMIDAADPFVLSGIWDHANNPANGRFRFRLSEQRLFRGCWTYGEAKPSVEYPNWTGTKL